MLKVIKNSESPCVIEFTRLENKGNYYVYNSTRNYGTCWVFWPFCDMAGVVNCVTAEIHLSLNAGLCQRMECSSVLQTQRGY